MLTQKDITKERKTLSEFIFKDSIVDKEAATILNSATLAVKAILERREELDKQGRQNEPLVVLAGEAHTYPSNYLHHIAVLSQLKKQEPTTALALEFPHNDAESALLNSGFSFKKLFNKEAYKESLKQEMSKDHRAEALFRFSKKAVEEMAPFSRNILLHSCLENDIAVFSTDAARERITAVDTSDPSTYNSTISCFGEVPKIPMSVEGRPGNQVRNHHMAVKLNEFAHDNGARIIIQQCGGYHIANIYEDRDDVSLSAALKKQNTPLLAYYLSNQDLYHEKIAGNALIKKDEIVTLPEIPKRSAHYVSGSVSKYFGQQASTSGPKFYSPKVEAAYVNVVLSQMGLSEFGLNSRTYKKLRKQRLSELNKRYTP